MLETGLTLQWTTLKETLQCQCENRHSSRIIHIPPLVTWRNEKPPTAMLWKALTPGLQDLIKNSNTVSMNSSISWA